MKYFFFVSLISFFALAIKAEPLPGDSASFQGRLNGQNYQLYQMEFISYDIPSKMTEFKLITILEEGTREETIKKMNTITEDEGTELERLCEQWGERIEYHLASLTIPSCRLRDISNPEFFIDAAPVPFGFVRFQDSTDGSDLRLIEFHKN